MKAGVDTAVAIVGGGLAGLSAAITLAQAGAQVTLFEARHYPQHRVCGEYLSPECSLVLNALGASEAIRALHPPALHTTVITAPDGTSWAGELPTGGIGLSRYALDELLCQQAQALGAEIRVQTTVAGIDGDLEQGYTLHTRGAAGQGEFRAGVVLCAQGKRSLLDRALERPFLSHAQPYLGLKAHYQGPPMPGRVALHTFPGGYCGLSHIEGGKTNLCLLARTEAFRSGIAEAVEGGSPDAGIDAFIGWIATQNAEMRRWLDQAVRVSDWCSTHQVPFVSKERSLRGMLMVGDAAGLIAPLAGDGMGMALQGGQMAARHTLAYLAGDVTAAVFAPNYAADWQRRFAPRLRLGRALQACLLRPRLASSGLHLLNAVPALGRYFVAHTRDRDAMSSPAGQLPILSQPLHARPPTHEKRV